jgi:guanylate kinase
VHGQSYGTLRAEVEKSLHAGRDIVLEIDVQGAEQLAECGLPMVSIFVQPPSVEILRQRLIARGTEEEDERERRLAIVEEEMKSASFYDFVVVNDEIDGMVEEVENILGLEVSA